MLKKSVWVAVGAGIFITIIGARWSVIGRFGTDLPEWDQWDAEGVNLLIPWFKGRLLPALFTPHNEHYVVLTKLQTLGLTLLNGQWDQRLACVANAFLPALLAIATFAWVRRFSGARFSVATALLLAAAWSLPLSWQNVVSGFHSQQFYLIILSFAAIASLPFAATGSARWWLGVAAAGLAPLSMASGALAAVAVLLLLGLRALSRAGSWRATWPAGLIATAICVASMLTRHDVHYHAALKAQSAQDFVQTFLQALQWPAMGSPWFAALIWFPWLAVVVVLLRRPRQGPPGNHGWLLLGLGSWIWLQLLATAYARGAGGPPPAVRYLDLLVFGCTVNWLALRWLWSGIGANRLSRALLAIGGLAWTTVVMSGGFRVTRTSLGTDLPPLAVSHHEAVIRTRGYLETHDVAHLSEGHVPYPVRTVLAEHLNRPELAMLLPASVRPALRLAAAAGSSGFELFPNDRMPDTFASLDAASEPGGDLGPASNTPPAFRRIWTSFTSPSGVGEWTSQPVRGMPWGTKLVLAIVGTPGTDGIELELRDARTGERLTAVRAPLAPEGVWRYAVIAAPQRDFVVHARDGSPDSGMGFSEPAAMGLLSCLGWLCVSHGSLVAGLGMVLIALSGLAALFTSRLTGGGGRGAHADLKLHGDCRLTGV